MFFIILQWNITINFCLLWLQKIHSCPLQSFLWCCCICPYHHCLCCWVMCQNQTAFTNPLFFTPSASCCDYHQSPCRCLSTVQGCYYTHWHAWQDDEKRQFSTYQQHLSYTKQPTMSLPSWYPRCESSTSVQHILLQNRAIYFMFIIWMAAITDLDAHNSNNNTSLMDCNYWCNEENTWICAMCGTLFKSSWQGKLI